jgi:hypothetical protein
MAIKCHWAICDKKGAIMYDDEGRAEIWQSRATAEKRIVKVTGEYSEVLHVEKVSIS